VTVTHTGWSFSGWFKVHGPGPTVCVECQCHGLFLRTPSESESGPHRGPAPPLGVALNRYTVWCLEPLLSPGTFKESLSLSLSLSFFLSLSLSRYMVPGTSKRGILSESPIQPSSTRILPYILPSYPQRHQDEPGRKVSHLSQQRATPWARTSPASAHKDFEGHVGECRVLMSKIFFETFQQIFKKRGVIH